MLLLFFSGLVDQIGNLHCTTPLAASSNISLELEGFCAEPKIELVEKMYTHMHTHGVYVRGLTDGGVIRWTAGMRRMRSAYHSSPGRRQHQSSSRQASRISAWRASFCTAVAWLGSVDFLMKGDLPSSRKKHAWPLQNLISETADSEKTQIHTRKRREIMQTLVGLAYILVEASMIDPCMHAKLVVFRTGSSELKVGAAI